MKEVFKVGMADMQVTKPPNTLVTLGLGSCIGICIVDPVTKVAGLAHIMLPSSSQIKNNSNIAKFADTAIDKLVNDMLKLGAKKERLVSKIAGGAQMFSFSSQNDMMKIGERNAQSVKEQLKKHNIPLKFEDTGGNYGRSIEFVPDDGSLIIKTIGHGTKVV
jgi:chemotaxis protein CheD